MPYVTELLDATDDDDCATELLDLVLLLDTLVSLLLDCGVTLDEDLVSLLLDTLVSLLLDCGVTLDEDLVSLLLDTLVSLLLDCGVTLLLDPSAGSGTLELLDSSQSSHTLEDESPEGCVAKSLSSSPQAASNAMAARDSPINSFFIVNLF